MPPVLHSCCHSNNCFPHKEYSTGYPGTLQRIWKCMYWSKRKPITLCHAAWRERVDLWRLAKNKKYSISMHGNFCSLTSFNNVPQFSHRVCLSLSSRPSWDNPDDISGNISLELSRLGWSHRRHYTTLRLVLPMTSKLILISGINGVPLYN